jgi:O-antigen/teichoic acid export membrane protein
MTPAGTKEQDFHRLVRFVGLNTLIHPFVTFCVSIIVARSLGPEGRGTYGLLVAAVGTFPLVVGFGLAYATRFWCARGTANAHSLLKTMSLVGTLFGAIVSCVVMVSWWTDAPTPFIPPGLGRIGIAALALTLFLTTLTRFWVHYLAGHERYAYSTWGVTAGAGLQAIVLLWVWKISQASLDLAAVALAIQAIFLFILFPFLSGTSLREVLTAPLLSASELMRMLRYGVWPYLSGLLGIANVHLVVFLISAVVGFYETGLYTAIVGPANLLLLFGAPLNLILPARTARRIGDPDFSHQVAVALRLILCLTVMAAALGAVIAPTVIPWIFGVGFEGAVAPFQILLLGMVALALKSIIVKYITGLGRPRWSTAISATNATISIALCIVLLPIHGALGAAVAVTVGHLCSVVFGVYAFLRVSGLDLRQLLNFQARDWVPLTRVLGLVSKGDNKNP